LVEKASIAVRAVQETCPFGQFVGALVADFCPAANRGKSLRGTVVAQDQNAMVNKSVTIAQ
jgi:hypothetical protein